MPGFTDNEATQLARDLQTSWGETNKIRETRRRLRTRDEDPPLPPGWSKNVHIKHKTYEIEDSIVLLRNRMIAAPISVLVFAKSGEASAQGRASDIQHFLKKVWMDFNSGYPSAHYVGTDSQVADGAWAAHVTWDPRWIELGQKAEDIDEWLKGAGLPFLLETPDLLNVYVEFDRKKLPRRVVTIEKVEIAELAGREFMEADGSKYYLNFDEKGREIEQGREPKTYDNLYSGDFRETVMVASVEDAGFVHRVLIEGPEEGKKRSLGLGKWPNLFKRPAWVFMAGNFANSTDPLQRWKPLVEGMYSMGNEINMVRSARLNSGMLAGLPRVTLVPDDPKGLGPIGEKQKPELVMNEDGTVTIPDGWHVEPFQFPTGADALLQNTLESVNEEVSRYKPPPILQGVREEGVSSGYQQAQIAEAAMSKLDPYLNIQSQGIADILYLVLDGVKAIAEQTEGKISSVYVRNLVESHDEGGLTRTREVLELRAKEIDDFEITVRQSSMSPMSRIGLIEEGRRGRQAGEIDDQELYEHFYGYEDGLEMQRRALDQKMFDAMVPEAINIALERVRRKVAAARPVILGPTGEPIGSAAGMPPPGIMPTGDAQATSVPSGSAAPGLDATLVQPTPPVPAPMPLGSMP